MKKIKPILRYPGSKFRKLNRIIETLDIKESDTFLDMFSGSGIVGVNVKLGIGAKVTINDFDGMFPITANKAMKNQLSFQGMGKCFTKAAFEAFNKRIKNGFWERLEEYNDIINECKVIKLDWLKTYTDVITNNRCDKVYVDPPYDGIMNLYKNSFSKEDHTQLKNVLELMSFNLGSKILISYNDTPFIRELYKDWNIQTEDFTYQTGKLNRTNKKARVKELWITNFKENNEI